MHLLHPHLHSRRAFLRRASQLAMTGTALPLALNMSAMGEAAAQGAAHLHAPLQVLHSGSLGGNFKWVPNHLGVRVNNDFASVSLENERTSTEHMDTCKC